MDICLISLLISLLREYIVNYFTGTTSILHPPPPPPTDINMNLHKSSRSSPNAFVEGCRSVSVTYQKQLKISPTLAGRLQDVRKWWNLLPELLGVISLIDIVGSLRDRVVSCSASDRQDSNFLCLEGSVISFILLLIRFLWPSLAYMCLKLMLGRKRIRGGRSLGDRKQ